MHLMLEWLSPNSIISSSGSLRLLACGLIVLVAKINNKTYMVYNATLARLRNFFIRQSQQSYEKQTLLDILIIVKKNHYVLRIILKGVIIAKGCMWNIAFGSSQIYTKSNCKEWRNINDYRWKHNLLLFSPTKKKTYAIFILLFIV